MMPEDWIVPDWPAPNGVKAFITTRTGGVSTGPYASFNLGWSTGDRPAAVRENRRRLRALLPQEPRWLKQVHGATVINADTAHDVPEADAAVARERGTVCAILVADCVPVLFTDRAGRVVAAAHAGWRGLACGVLEQTIAAMTRHGLFAGDLLAFIGPGIGPQHFEVGPDVYEAFTARAEDARAAFAKQASGKWLADLFMLVRHALQRCGVEQIYGGGLCTFSTPSRFYSYRRDRTTGRMAALIWREDCM